MSDLDFQGPADTQRGSGVRTERHSRTIGERVRCTDTGEAGEIFAYSICGDYYVNVDRPGGVLRQLGDSELTSL